MEQTYKKTNKQTNNQTNNEDINKQTGKEKNNLAQINYGNRNKQQIIN